MIHSKEKKVKGNVCLETFKARNDTMYDWKTEKPEYSPKFDLAEKKSPKLVNYGAKRVADERKVVEWEEKPKLRLGTLRVKREKLTGTATRAFGLEV